MRRKYMRLPRLLGVLISAVVLLADITLPAFAQESTAPNAVKVVQVDTSRFPEVGVWVSVLDAQGNPVTSLPGSAFSLTENGQPVTVTSVSRSGDEEAGSVSTILAIDRSGSMTSSGKMEAAKAAATAFVDQMRATDSTGVVAFNTQVQVVQPLISDKDALRRAIAGIQAAGNTAIYDALGASVDMLSNAPGRRAIILLSDGLDNSSRQTVNALIDRIKGVELSIETIGLGDPSRGTGSVGGIDETALRGIAEQSRGSYTFAPNPQGLATLYGKLSRQLQNQYRLSYVSSNILRDGVGRGINVQVVGVGGAEGIYNPGGIIPETPEALTWPVFGGLLLGLGILLILPGLLRNLNGSRTGIAALRRRSRVKLTGGSSSGQQTRKPRVRVQGKSN